MENSLTTAEQAEFAELETTIEKGKDTWIEVGLAFCKIRSRKLYRKTHATFELYCHERWDMTRQRALQLENSAVALQDVMKNLTTMVVISPPSIAQPRTTPPDRPKTDSNGASTRKKDAPVSERAARELSRVPPDRRVEVFQTASTNGTPTATAIKKAFGPPPDVKPKLPPKPPAVLDDIGRVIPPDIVSLWQRAGEVKDLLSGISKARTAIKKAEDDQDILFVGVNYSSILADLSNAYNTVKLAMPYTVCPSCQGQPITRPNCRLCHKRGFISAFTWKTSISEEQKNLILSTVK